MAAFILLTLYFFENIFARGGIDLIKTVYGIAFGGYNVAASGFGSIWKGRDIPYERTRVA
jgi:hypothetical protein